jgi:hypothetical protein
LVLLAWLAVIVLGIGNTADRILYDASITLSILVCVLCALLWNQAKFIPIFTAVIIVIGVVNLLPQWFVYHSTVTEADKQAIKYLNTLPYDYFTTDAEVQPNIYKMYIKQDYQRLSKEILIARNKPMTLNSDKDSHSFIAHGIGDKTEGFVLDKTFSDGKITVEVWVAQ